MKMDIESRNIAIFLSSTFDDMGGERKAVKQAVDSLRRYAQNRGINIRLVDLRLGIENAEEEADVYSEKVIRLCLESVENCRPYFIGLLGKRYGWIPDKETIALNKALFSDAHYDLINQALNDEKSVTEMEMMLGILNAEEKNAFVYCLDEAVEVKTFDAYKAEKLENNHLRDKPLSEEDIYHKYHHCFLEEDSKMQKLNDLKKRLTDDEDVEVNTYKNEKDLIEFVSTDLKNYIESNFPDALTEEEKEVLSFKGFLEKKTMTYIEREEVEAQVKSYINGDSLKPLLITGKSGMGKSTLIAKVQSEINSKYKKIYAYYVGATAMQNTSTDIMRDIMRRLKVDFESIFGENPIATSNKKLPLEFAQWLHRITEDTLIIIDGINQLQDKDNYDWLPYSLSEHVKMILSSADEDGPVIDKIQSRYDDEISLIKLNGLSKEERIQLIKNEYTIKHGKHNVGKDVIETLVSDKSLSFNPLYVETMVNEIVHYGEFDNLKKFIEGYQEDHNRDGNYDLSDIYITAMKKRILEFTNQSIREIFALLTVTATGLSEEELQEILLSQYKMNVSNLELRLIIGSLNEYLLSYEGRVKWKHDYLDKAIHNLLDAESFKVARYAIVESMGAELADEKDNRKFSEVLQQLIFLKEYPKIIEILKQVSIFQLYNTHEYYEKAMVLLSNQRMSHEVLEPLYQVYKTGDVMESIFSLSELLSNHGLMPNALNLREIEYDYYVIKDGLNSRTALVRLNNLGYIHQVLGNYEEALGHYESCYKLKKDVLGANHPSTLSSLNNLGNIHLSLGNYEEALGYSESCYKLFKEVLGEKHLSTLTSLNNLGSIHESLGNYEQALDHSESCYKLIKEVLGEKHPSTLRSLNNLGYIHSSIGNYQEALGYYESCYKLMKEVLGAKHSSTLGSLNNLGSIHQTLGNYVQALGYYESCYKLMKEVLGAKHPSTLDNLNNLGSIHSSLGNYEEALGHYESCYKLRKEVLGTNHPDTLDSLNNLGSIRLSLGNYEEAIGHYESCYKLMKEVLGAKHPSTLRSLNNLGSIHSSLGHYEEALGYYESCYKLSKEVLGAKHSDTLNSLNNLGSIHSSLGNYEEALRHSELCYKLRKEVLGEKHPSTLRGLNNLGGIHLSLGNYEEALGHYELCYKLRKEVLGERHPSTLDSLNNLGYIHQTLGNYEEALGHSESCYKLSKEILGKRHPDTLNSLNNLGGIHHTLGNYEDALSHYESCYRLSKEVLGAKHPDTLNSLNNLGSIHSSLGHYEEALGYSESCYKLIKEVLGAKHPDTLSSLNNLGSIHSIVGNYEESLDHYELCYKLRKETLGENHKHTENTALNQVSLLIKISEKQVQNEVYIEAKELLFQARDLYDNVKQRVINLEYKIDDLLTIVGEKLKEDGLFYESILRTIEILSSDYIKYSDMIGGRNNKILRYHLEKKEYVKAIKFLENAYDVQMSILGEMHNSTLVTLNNLAYTHNEHGNYEKAKQLHIECLNKRIDAFGENDLKVSSSHHNLAGVYKNTQDYNQAINHVSKSIEIRKQHKEESLLEKSQNLLNEIRAMDNK